jgi:hypothetical protein
MKKLLLLLFILGFYFSVSAQRVYFIYIQSEAGQPFYVKLNEKVYSSVSGGYLILSHLRDSSYSFSVGFPGMVVVEPKFTVSMNGKDRGYILKNFDEKGWGLFDLQTMVTVMAANNASQLTEDKKEITRKDESAFAQILARASDDSTLLEKSLLSEIKEEKKVEVSKQEVIQPVNTDTLQQAEQRAAEKKQATTPENKTDIAKEEVKPPAIIDSIKQGEQKTDEKNIMPEEQKKIGIIDQKPAETKKEEPPVIPAKEEPITQTEDKQTERYKRSSIIRKSESSTLEGFGVVFVDEYADGQKDTIRILIPHIKTASQPEKPTVKEEKVFLNISPDTTKPASVVNEEKPVAPKTPAGTQPKNNCPVVASESDFLKLRKKMAGETDDAGMVAEAVKIFKFKCFTTEQIKNLSSLFLNDEGKYKFFDAAYSYVSDSENFPALQTELKDIYYINRFKAMLR